MAFVPGTLKKIEQFFSKFLGEDLKSSPLTRSRDAYISMKNLEPRENTCLMGRQGCKIAAQQLYIRKLHTYHYTDDDGVSQEELLAIGVENFTDSGGSLYRLKQGSFTVTRAAGSTSWDFNVDRNSSDAVFKFSIYQGGAVYASQLIDGGYEASPYTIYTLCGVIDALTNFSCTYPKTAKVNGAQSNFSLESTGVTVDTGHTVSVGDILPFYNRNTSKYEWREVISTSATKLYFKSNVNASFNDDDIIGLGRLPAFCLNLHGADEDTTSPKTVYFDYWEKVPCSVDYYSITTQPFSSLSSAPGNEDYFPVSFTDQRNCCYITSNYALSSDQAQFIGEVDQDTNGDNTIIASQIVEKYTSGVWKYDGKDFYMAGLPGVSFSSAPGIDVAYKNPFFIAKTSTGSLTAGTYKYRHSILYVDRRGNEVEFFNQFTMNVTENSGTFYTTITVQSVPFGVAGNIANYYNARYARVNGAVVASTSITVDAGHTIRTGDTIFFNKSTGFSTQKRKVTAWTNTTITVDEACSIDDNNYISTILHRIWRTKVNSYEYFLALSIPNDSTSSTTAYVDDLADADLGISITSVEPDYIQYALPPANVIAAHQNILVLGGGKKLPKQVAWENADGIEFTNPGVFSETIPSKTAGDIVGLSSDTEAALAAFKNTSQFRFNGSITNVQYDLTKVNDTGKGMSGPSSYTEADNFIIGVGKAGLVYTKGGSYLPNFGDAYIPYFNIKNFDTEETFVLERAQVFHDEDRSRVLFFIPCETLQSGSPTGYCHNTNSKLFIWDYSDEENPIWYRHEYALKRMPSAGFAYYNNKLYFANWIYDTNLSRWTGYTYVRLENEVASAPEDYLDNCESYTWELETQWDNAGDSEAYKFWHEFAMYMFQPENDLADFFVGAFDVTVVSQRDYTTSKTDTSRTLAFASSSDLVKKFQFDKNYKAIARNIKLSGTINKNAPIISGYVYTRDDVTYSKDKYVP